MSDSLDNLVALNAASAKSQKRDGHGRFASGGRLAADNIATAKKAGFKQADKGRDWGFSKEIVGARPSTRASALVEKQHDGSWSAQGYRVHAGGVKVTKTEKTNHKSLTGAMHAAVAHATSLIAGEE
jgi:hypothetical protein